MNNLGISSAYSAYKANQVSFISDKQESSRAEENNSIKPPYPDEINDEAVISDDAKTLLAKEESDTQNQLSDKVKEESKNEEKTKENTLLSKTELTPSQEQEVAELKIRDLEVKAHEQAHVAAASGISVSSPDYEYQTGPDGKKYAVGGEVNISFVSGGDPASDIAKAEAMKASALAPAQPSSQDLSVARNAERIIAESKQELTEQQSEMVETIGKSAKTENPEDIKEAFNDTKIKSD